MQGFLAVLVRNRAWFLPSGLESDMLFLEEDAVSYLIKEYKHLF